MTLRRGLLRASGEGIVFAAFDDFADTGDLNGSTPPIGVGNWAQTSVGDWKEEAGQARQNTAAVGHQTIHLDSGLNDNFIMECNCFEAVAGGLVFDSTSLTDFWGIQLVDGGTPLARIMQRSGGGFTVRGTPGAIPNPITNNLLVKIEVIEPNVVVSVNGSVVTSYSAYSKSGNTRQGLWSFVQNSKYLNYKVWSP